MFALRSAASSSLSRQRFLSSRALRTSCSRLPLTIATCASQEQRATKAAGAGGALLALMAAALVAGREGAAKMVEEVGETEEEGEMRQLYPPIEPYNSGYLRVSSTHKIYFEESGNPEGKPVVFVHGGPGGGCSPGSRRYFDPRFYRIVCFDQRGAGKSLPHACLEENTTWGLVSDMESLRRMLGIDKWMVFGGSWGSCLGLAYAEAHPERVTELVLRGIFLLRPHELRWFYQEGASFLFPDFWEGYRDAIPEAERGDFMAAYRRRLTDPDPAVRAAAAKAWAGWEMATLSLRPAPATRARADDGHWAEAFARIENHFFVNAGWFPTPDYLIENVGRIRHIPAVIVQGRYDVVCPATTAWDLHRAWPEARFELVVAGHAASEPEIADRLLQATDRFRVAPAPSPLMPPAAPPAQ